MADDLGRLALSDERIAADKEAARELSARLGAAIADGVLSVDSPADLRSILASQEEALLRLAESNDALRSLNEHAAENLAHASARFAQHTGTVTQLTSDLTRAYARIRQLKERLSRRFPEAFAQASAAAPRPPQGAHSVAVRESAALGDRQPRGSAPCSPSEYAGDASAPADRSAASADGSVGPQCALSDLEGPPGGAYVSLRW